jgi:heptosyltransferase-2
MRSVKNPGRLCSDRNPTATRNEIWKARRDEEDVTPAEAVRDPGSLRRIVVRAPTWVGDAVMATPALRSLRAAHPSARITVEGHAALEGLLNGLSSFDEFLVDSGRGAWATRNRAHRLREREFELAVLLPDSPRAALGPYLARIPRRIGYARDPLRRVLLTDPLYHPRCDGRRTAIPTTQRYLEITRRLGCVDRGTQPELRVAADAAARVDRELILHGVGASDDLLVVTPGASFGSSKLWPTAHFARASDRIARELELIPVLSPGPGEFEIAEHIAAQMEERAVVLIDGQPRLEDLKALIARSQLLLTNDTGPRHIAAALRRPAVVVIGPTNPTHSALHLEQQRVLRRDLPCSPCQLKVCPIDHRCMTGLHPDLVVEAARGLLENSAGDGFEQPGV